ncbi:MULTISPECIES: phage virion morphogenesis protein [unclassified Sphingomonas]|uniref:phage virion morphogenesis protein n=1 Tax=unclassified Sphingomonas TaxID=196159 RepID=UPI00082FF4CF|nr:MULTISPECIES: phage virion morphogenesis protein [unclassified Sphingomonas]
MSVALEIRAEGQQDVERKLGQLLIRYGDLTPLMQRIGVHLETTTIERFDLERAPDGARWLPSLRAKQTGGKTLTDTARLKQSIRFIASADRVEIGSNVRYARVHQEGATIRAKGGRLRFRLPGGLGFRSPEQVVIPARPFLGLSAENREEIPALADDFVAEALS